VGGMGASHEEGEELLWRNVMHLEYTRSMM
jgi:hypothetical protein